MYKQVHALVHAGKPILESNVILEYIEATWPHHHRHLLLDAQERAMARFWSNFFQDENSECEKEMEEVRVLGVWSSIYCHRVIWALNLKGVDFDYTEEDLVNKSDELRHYNPVNQQIPVFIHNGKPIAESIIILEYIDDIWPHNPLLPSDPYEKAMAQFWVKFLEDKSPTFYAYLRAVGEEQENLAEEAKELLHIIEEKGLGEKSFFGGDRIGFTDICLGWIACWLPLMQEAAGIKLLESNNLPRLQAWSRRFKEVSGIKDSLQDDDKMFNYFKGLRERFTTPPAH